MSAVAAGTPGMAVDADSMRTSTPRSSCGNRAVDSFGKDEAGFHLRLEFSDSSQKKDQVSLRSIAARQPSALLFNRAAELASGRGLPCFAATRSPDFAGESALSRLWQYGAALR
jgi:hypothetical protein